MNTEDRTRLQLIADHLEETGEPDMATALRQISGKPPQIPVDATYVTVGNAKTVWRIKNRNVRNTGLGMTSMELTLLLVAADGSHPTEPEHTVAK